MSQVKQAILLAAGFGSRLRPLTDSIPKCLVPINGKPLLYIWLEQLHLAGIESFLINTHYLSDKVVEAIQNHPLKDKVTLINEAQLLGTASTVRHLLHTGICQSEATLIAHADNLCLCHWKDFFDFYQQSLSSYPQVKGVLMTFQTDTPQSCGIVETDEQDILCDFHEKVPSPPSNDASAAIYVVSPALLNTFTAVPEVGGDISLDMVPKWIGKLRIWPCDGYIRDIGTPESYLLGQQDAKQYF